jgi:hypothetical protein
MSMVSLKTGEKLEPENLKWSAMKVIRSNLINSIVT